MIKHALNDSTTLSASAAKAKAGWIFHSHAEAEAGAVVATSTDCVTVCVCAVVGCGILWMDCDGEGEKGAMRWEGTGDRFREGEDVARKEGRWGVGEIVEGGLGALCAVESPVYFIVIVSHPTANTSKSAHCTRYLRKRAKDWRRTYIMYITCAR